MDSNLEEKLGYLNKLESENRNLNSECSNQKECIQEMQNKEKELTSSLYVKNKECADYQEQQVKFKELEVQLEESRNIAERLKDIEIKG